MSLNDEFDFDDWAALAAQDPIAFEAKRREVLRARIDAIPETHAQVKASLRSALLDAAARDGTPMERATQAFNKMHDSVLQLLDAHGAQMQDAPSQDHHRVPASYRYTRFVAK